MRRLPSLAAMLTLLSWMHGHAARAQSLGAADRAPQFYLASANSRSLTDASDVPMLRRRVSVRLNRAPLSDALEAISSNAKLKLVYAPDILPKGARVSLAADNITVTAALTEVLLDTGLDVIISSVGQMTLVRRQHGLLAPAGTIVGRVSQVAPGGVLSGVDVALEDTRWRTTTDTNGRYRLAGIDAGQYKMTFRRIGYAQLSRPVTVVADREDTVDVALEARPTRLDELVSTATGPQRRIEIANDVTHLNVDSIVRTQPVRSVTDILEGRVPGLTVQRTSGAPGDPARLRLRGASSPRLNNDPIVVVDGVRVYAEQSAARNANLATSSLTGTPFAAPSPLDYIDPNTIETIEVVKGPSAATLYGQDAANGVIVITTKKGRAGPTRWTFSGEHAVTEMPKQFPERVVRWGHQLYSEDAVVCPVTTHPPNGLPSTRCEPDSLLTFQVLNESDLTVLGHGQRTAGDLAVAGGSGSLTYNVIGSYSRDIGLLRLPDYEVSRYETRIGTTPPDWMTRPQGLTRWGVMTSLGVRLGATADLTLQTNLSQMDQQRSNLERQLGTIDATYLDRASGTYYDFSGGNGRIAAKDFVLSDYYTQVTATATALTTGASLQWRPWPWLQTEANAGVNLDQRVDGLFLPRGASLTTDSIGQLNSGRGKSLEQTLHLGGVATKALGGGFSLKLGVGADYRALSISDVSIYTADIPAGQQVLGEVSFPRPEQRKEDRATFGYYLAPAIMHRRFAFDLGLRLDGGNSYGARLDLPTFPKLGFSYMLSEESFFPFKNLFQVLKLRTAYGRSSRQPGPTDRLRLYTPTDQLVVDGQSVPAIDLRTLGNTTLRPERSSEVEGGFDADILDSRVSIGVSGFRKTTDDALLSMKLPPSIGFPSVLKNIGRTRNTGLDIVVHAQAVRSASMSWGVGLSMTHRRDEVVNLGAGVAPFYINEEQRVAEGYPLFGIWSKPVVGYSDVDGDGAIEKQEIILGDTAVYQGAPLPNYELTLQTDASLWRGAVQVTAGFLYDNGLTQRMSPSLINKLTGFSRGANDPNSSPGEQAIAASSALTTYNWHQRVSVARLNSVTVMYNLPTTIARRFGAQRLSVALQGSNLGVWSNYRGIDPNVNAEPTGEGLVDDDVLPQPRTWQVRVNATY